MPFKSKAQAKAMHAKADEGKIKPSVINEFDKATNFNALPNKVQKNGGLKNALAQK
jgi:hypothetical protein